MAYTLAWGQGDQAPAEEKQRIEKHFAKRYDSTHFLGVVTIGLHYTVGRGYHVAEANLNHVALGVPSPGGTWPEPRPREDYRRQVAAELQSLGLIVY